MKSQTLVAALVLGLAVVVQSSPAKLDQVYEQRESKSNLNDDDNDDDERRPYSFAYEASRHYHGAPDREHREERGEDGITRGVYRYVDPSLRVQEVIYTADENGFHVQSNNDPEYTDAQIVARERHAQLFQEIAEEHNRIGNEHALKAAERGYDPQQETYVAPQGHLDYSTGTLDPALLPQNSPAVERARTQHQELFAKIAEQHARIAAERKTDPRAEETGEPYEYQYDTPLKTVEVVSGSVGPSVLSRSASVVAPGEGHADFQGYGVPLGTFRDDLTEEEALALLEEENQRHLMQFMDEADNHERLVLAFMPPGATGANQGRVGFSGGNQGQFAGSSTAPQGGRRQGNGFVAGASGNRHQGASSAGSGLRSSGGAGKVQTSFSHKTPNAHSNTQGQSRFSIGSVDPLRSDSHNQRAIGGAGIKFNNQEQFSLNDPESVSYSAGGAGSQPVGNAGGRTQLSSASTGSGPTNSNAYSSGQRSSVAQASGSQGVGGSARPEQFLAKPQGNFESSQGQYSGGNQAGGNAAQFAGGNKQNQHGSTTLSSGATGQASGGQYTSGNQNQGSAGQASFSSGGTQEKKQGQHNAAGGHTQPGQATFSGHTQQQGKKQGQYNAAGGHTQQGQATFSGQAQQQGNKQGQYNAAGGHTQQGQATFSGQAQQQGKKQGQYNAADAQTQQGGQASFSRGNQQQGNKQDQYGVAGTQTQQGGQASFSGGNQQPGNKQGQYGVAGIQTQQGGQASFSVGNQPQGKKQGQINAAGGHTHQGGHASYSGGNQQHGTKQGPHGFAVAQTQDAGNQQRQNKQGHSSGAGGAGLSAASSSGYQASQQGQQGGGSHSLSSSGSSGHFQGSQRQQQGAGLQTLAGGDYGHSADHEQARALLEEQRQNHLRQFRKIAQAHEQIGDEHHQLTLATLQKHKMKIQNW